MTADEFEQKFVENADYYIKIFSKPFFQQKTDEDARYLRALKNIKEINGGK